MTTSTDTIDDALHRWGKIWREASEKITALCVLGIATMGKELGVTTVVFTWSDQGDWLTIESVEGPEGSDNDDAYDELFDAFDASDLRGEWQSDWAGYLTTDDHGRVFKLDVAAVLAELTFDQIGTPEASA